MGNTEVMVDMNKGEEDEIVGVVEIIEVEWVVIEGMVDKNKWDVDVIEGVVDKIEGVGLFWGSI